MKIFFPGRFCILACLLLANWINAQEFTAINGNKIQYEIKGSGRPNVVFVAGYGGALSSFDPVFNQVSEFSTAIRYSRSGLGKSSYANPDKDFDAIVNELESLIDTLHVQEPFVLIGHSFGGLIIRAYAKKHPSKIAGLLFDDATFEDYFKILTPLEKNAEKLEWEDHQDVMRKYPVKAMDDEFKSLWKVWHTPGNWKKWFDPMPRVPTVVLTSMKIADSSLRANKDLMNARYRSQSRWLKDKPFSMQIGLVDAGHFVHGDAPLIFVESVHMLIDAIRQTK